MKRNAISEVESQAAELVPQRPEQTGADDRTQDRGRRYEPLRGRGHSEVLSDERIGDSDDEEVEPVQHDAEPREQPEAHMKVRHRCLVERPAERERIGVRAHRRHSLPAAWRA
jgi:hypothetical protein